MAAPDAPSRRDSKTETRRGWSLLKKGEPGRRFRDVHDWRAERRGPGWPASRVLTLVVGVVLLVGGLGVGWVPGPGGFVGVIGAALLATEWRFLAELLDWAEVQVRELWRRVRRRRDP